MNSCRSDCVCTHHKVVTHTKVHAASHNGEDETCPDYDVVDHILQWTAVFIITAAVIR